MMPSFSLKPLNVSTSGFLCGMQCGRRRASQFLLKQDDHALEMSSVFTSSLTVAEPGRLVVRAGSSVLSANERDLLPLGGENALVLEQQEEGIGIVKFLTQKVLLITGATGFLGKVLIEKILRTAPDVHKIFVLIKASDKEAAAERLNNEIIRSELFKRLEQIHGKTFQAFMSSKLIPVAGDLCEPDLGLNEDDALLIAKDANIIMNSAATTSFDERYDTAININTRGPMRILDFAKRCSKLLLFVQVSTAYVNGPRQGRIMEQPFSREEWREGMRFGCQKQQLIIEDEVNLVLQSKKALKNESDPQMMRELGKQRSNKFGWHDTYTFTKAMGEMMIESLRGNVPVVIIRPSVIESTYWEPFPGWMEGNRMMDPIIMNYGKRHLTGFLVDPDGVIDVVPADMVVNAILAATAKHGKEGKPEMNIYQVASSVVNPLAFGDLAALLYEHFKQSPLLDSTGNPIHVTPFKLFSSMEDFGTHLWQHTLDRFHFGASGKLDRKLSEKLQKICRKSVEQAKYLASIYQPYTFHSGRFDNSNARRLMEYMCNKERQQFGFDVSSINWKDYICKVHIPGLRRHVMKGRDQEYL